MKFSSFKNQSNNISLPQLLFIFFVILLPILVQAQDCQPSGCVARCNGGCGTNQVCTLGTMKDCGVCPSSRCIDQTVLGLPPSSTPSTSPNINDNENDSQSEQSDENGGSNKGSLIGGLVGGLLGGLLLFACVGFWAVRRFKGKASNMLPFTQQMNERNISSMSNHREVTSGVIPVAYIPPSPEVEHKTLDTLNNNLSPPPAATQRASLTANANIAAAALAAATNSDDPDNRYESKYLDELVPNEMDRKHQSKYLSASYESDGDESLDTRASVASTISNNPTTPAKTTYAVQVSRARPTIMRVNQVRIDDVDGNGSTNNLAGGTSLSRSGSVRTILTRDDGSEIGSVVRLSRSNTAPAKRLLSNRSPRSPIQQQQQRTSIVRRNQRPTTIINTDPHLIEATVNKSVIINRGSPRSEDDPFHDRHSALIESVPQIPASHIHNTNRRHSTLETRHHSNTPTTDSRILGDGEITIYWNNAYDEQQKDDTSISTTGPLSTPSSSGTRSNPQK